MLFKYCQENIQYFYSVMKKPAAGSPWFLIKVLLAHSQYSYFMKKCCPYDTASDCKRFKSSISIVRLLNFPIIPSERDFRIARARVALCTPSIAASSSWVVPRGNAIQPCCKCNENKYRQKRVKKLLTCKSVNKVW